jgi:PAS domain S-box-containing protein
MGKAPLLDVDYKKLFDEVPCYISVQDSNFIIQQVNRRFREDFGNGVGHPCFEIYKHRKDRCPTCPVAMTFEDGMVHSSEEIVQSYHGEPISVVVYTAPLTDRDNKIGAVMEMSTNISEVKNLQAQLVHLGLLVASISHSIKSIVTGLEGGIYVVNSGFTRKNDDVLKKGWDMVQRNVERISNMVMEILYCAKDRTPQKTRLIPVKILEDVYELFHAKAQLKGIRLLKNTDSGIGEIIADPNSLHLLLISLIENAIDACLMDENKQSHEITLALKKADKDIVFEVTDNGVGMDEATKSQLFSNMYTTKPTAGTGLGLFVAYKIAKEHGAAITIDSVSGKGTTFTVSMTKAV